MDQDPLQTAILDANSHGWTVSLHQHPDDFAYWECSLSRRSATPHINGIARDITFGIGDSPISALDCAMINIPAYTTREPTGLRPGNTLSTQTPNLLTLLNLKPAGPPMTRRL